MGSNPEYSKGAVIAGKYVVEGFLGESPAGRIYLANENLSSQKICLKFYKPEISARLLAEPDFFLKAGQMTTVTHDNLCACYDVQEEAGLIFVARAFAEGQSFEEWARDARREPNYFTQGLNALWQVCEGLSLLHEKTRHRNVHAGNVFVGPLTAKLCDWDPRALGNMEMTPDGLPTRSEYQGYRAPEARGRGFLSYPSTDLYAVAGLFFRMLKDEHPFADPAQTLREARTLDKDIVPFFEKALQPKPEDRFQDASAFAGALWALQPAMQRMQERSGKAIGAPGSMQPKAADPAPLAADEDEPPPSGNNVTLFDFVPTRNPDPAAGNVTFVGDMTGKKKSKPGDGPTGKKPPQDSEPPGMQGLEGGATLYESQPPPGIFPTKPKFQQSRPEPRAPKPPPQANPISLSSLEKEPMDLTMSGEIGMTQFGFKGMEGSATILGGPSAQGNQTMLPPGAGAAAPNRKLWLLLAAAAVLIVGLTLVGVFLILRQSSGSAAAQPAASEATPPAPAAAAPSPTATPPVSATPAESAPVAPAPQTPPPSASPATTPAAPSAAQTNAAPSTPSNVQVTQGAATAAGANRITPAPAAAAGAAASHATPTPATGSTIGNAPATSAATEKLEAANKLNEDHKTAEANAAYAEALAAPGITTQQKNMALGGLATTYQALGQRDKALEAVDKLLEINPNNKFALNLKAKLK